MQQLRDKLAITERTAKSLTHTTSHRSYEGTKTTGPTHACMHDDDDDGGDDGGGGGII